MQKVDYFPKITHLFGESNYKIHLFILWPLDLRTCSLVEESEWTVDVAAIYFNSWPGMGN
jgi:hypothetical protein